MSNFSEGEAGEQGACGSLGVELDLVSGEESLRNLAVKRQEGEWLRGAQIKGRGFKIGEKLSPFKCIGNKTGEKKLNGDESQCCAIKIL